MYERTRSDEEREEERKKKAEFVEFKMQREEVIANRATSSGSSAEVMPQRDEDELKVLNMNEERRDRGSNIRNLQRSEI